MPTGSERGKAEEIGIRGLEEAELVGRGGAAVVYKAKQASLQRIVAVKLLTSSWDESVARRFDREQRAMGRLSNRPGIVPVYESGLNANGVPYIIMPYYPDGSLKDLSAEEGPIAWERAADLILQVSDAVGSAHDEGVVHRDLKPANVLLTSTGRPLLTDFGIARLTSDATGVETTAVTFTPAYCPPEVMDNADPDPRADTYALAATFWALVEGRPPFTDSNTSLAMDAVLKRVLTEPPPTLQGVPPAVASFIERCMSKEPAERPADGHAFAAQLREAIAASLPGSSHANSTITDEDETVVATRPVVIEQMPDRTRRRWIRPAAAMTMAVVLGLIVLAVFRRPGSGSADEIASGANTPTDTGAEVSVVVVQPGESVELLPLGIDPLSSASVEARRAAIVATQDFGPIAGISVDVLPTVGVDCTDGIGETVRAALETTRAAVLVGSTCTESVVAVMEAARDRELLWIASDLRSPGLTARADGTAGGEHVDGFFRTAQNDQFQGTVAAQFALDELGAGSAIVVRGIDPGQSEIAASFKAAFEQAGDVTILEIADATDLATAAADSIEADADVSFWILDAEIALALVDAIKSQPGGGVGQTITIADVLTPSVARQQALVDSFVVIPLQPSDDAVGATGRSLAEITAAYVEEYGEPLEDELAFAAAYDATILALESMQATATVSEGALTLDREQLRGHVESVTSEGLTGPLACNYLGDCGSQAMAIVQIDGVSLSSSAQNIIKLFDRAS